MVRWVEYAGFLWKNMASIRAVVIGGGVMGLGCAWRLARAGAAVEVLEARHCGEGATLAALGALWPASPLIDGPLQRLHRASLWEFEAFVAELQSASGKMIHFERRGRVELLSTHKAVERAAEEAMAACRDWPAFGGERPAMELLEPAQVTAEFPHIAAHEQAALLCRATAQVRVGDLVEALRAACVGAGVKIHEETAATGLEWEGDRLTGVLSKERVFPAESVLVAAGAWSALLSPEIAEAAPIRPAKGQGLALAMPAGLKFDTIVKSESIYLIPWQGRETGEILVGSTTEPEAGFDETPSADGRTVLTCGAAALVPALADMPVLRQWAGLRPQNPAKRHPPIMGVHPRIPNLFVCTGHFKTGIGLAPLVSRLMAGVMMEDALCAELAEFAPW